MIMSSTWQMSMSVLLILVMAVLFAETHQALSRVHVMMATLEMESLVQVH